MRDKKETRQFIEYMLNEGQDKLAKQGFLL